MKHDYFKFYKPTILPIVITTLVLSIFLAKEFWELSFSIFSIVITLLTLISTYLWKYKPFKWLFWIDDFSGRYEGFITYKYRDESGQLKSDQMKQIKIINQNGHRITINTFTLKKDGSKSSSSINKSVHVEKTEDEHHYRLIYSYLNDGSSTQNFSPHYGTEVIKFIKKDNQKILSGRYFTEREPFQTKGEFSELKWVSNNLNHDF